MRAGIRPEGCPAVKNGYPGKSRHFHTIGMLPANTCCREMIGTRLHRCALHYVRIL
jgi:hypothetical protein